MYVYLLLKIDLYLDHGHVKRVAVIQLNALCYLICTPYVELLMWVLA